MAACDKESKPEAGANTFTEVPSNANEVVVYTALDRQFSEPILQEFEKKTGIVVKPVYDTEAVKTVGLVNRLIAEKERPVCDVFWNNEIVRSLQLKKEGLTQPYKSPSAADIPDALKDPQNHWTGFAARARVILVNKDLLPNEAEWPRRVGDLVDPKWEEKAGFAKPLFGTTSTHAAVLWVKRSGDWSKEFWSTALKQAVVLPGNAQARDAVANGELAWCLTDTDDAQGAILDGKNVAIVYPDSGRVEDGTLLIPNTLVLIKGAPHTENGKKLIDYLLSREVEAALAASRSAQMPVRPDIAAPEGLPSMGDGKVMAVDWGAVSDALMDSQDALKKLFDEEAK